MDSLPQSRYDAVFVVNYLFTWKQNPLSSLIIAANTQLLFIDYYFIIIWDVYN